MKSFFMISGKSFLSNLVLCMNLTAILVLLLSISASATGFSQNKINLQIKKSAIADAISQIEEQSSYRFLYNQDLDGIKKKVSVNLKDVSIQQALRELLKNSGLSYQFINNELIAIQKKIESSQADIVVSGKVTDNKGEILIGVSVKVKGTNIGASTDIHGEFSISTPENAILVFSYLGFETYELRLSGQTRLSVILNPADSQLDEVVVVGYGTQKKATLTGSVTSVKGSEILQSPTTNVSNSLAGRLPGLVAVTPSSEPGADRTILRIRGMNTLNNNDPLIVVDGIPGRSLDRLDPSTIESISVLKDASAAIYGAQAANGVILVTTKRGKIGAPSITASFNQGYGTPTRLPEMADAPTYATMVNEIAYYKNPSGYTPVYSDKQIQTFADGSDPWNYPNTDWFKEVLKPWSGQSYLNTSVSGGSESVKYLISLGKTGQEGFYYNSGTKYNQYDFRTNLDGKINKNISLTFDVAGRMEDRNYPTRSAGSIFRMVMRGKPTMTAFWPNGVPGPDIEYGDNPVVVSTKATGYDHDKRYVVNSNVRLNVKIPWVEGLSLTGNAAIDKNFRFQKTWQTPWYLYSFNGFDANNQPILQKSKRGFDSPALSMRTEDNQNILLNGLVNYETKFLTDHNINLLLGIEKITGRGDNYSAYRRNFTSPLLDQMFAGATDQFMSNDGSAYSQARLNYFGRVNYDYKQKYLAEFVWRYQGSYIFPKESRFGFFPGISLGYRISEEKFWKDKIAAVNSLKLRASWGQTGNDQIDEYQYLAMYGLGGIRAQTWNPALTFITNGNVENPALYETVLPNKEVTWEVANQANIGFDATLLNDKISVTADYFNYTRSQILWFRNASVPSSAGIQLPRENIGKVGNKGFDFSVAYNGKAGELSYQFGVNGGYQKNKVLFWDEPAGAPDYQRTTGSPMFSNIYYNAIGIFKDQAAIDKYPHLSNALPGDVIFEDYNKDGKITVDDRVRFDKNTIPTLNGGFTINLSYKGFDFAALVQGAAGAIQYISTESGEIGNFLKDFADNRWTPQNPDASGPRTFNRGNEYWVGQSNTFWVHKTDYLRLKNLELGYSIPSSMIRRAGLKNLRVYINGYNLLTYSPDLKDFDPELGSGSGQGYPLQKIVNGGLSVTF